MMLRTWLESLPQWNPETEPDYLADFYRSYLEFADKGVEPFCIRMMKKWHVRMVELMLGVSNENPLMPILKGPQHIGKSYFVRHILPPELRDYKMEIPPSQHFDKDLIIQMSETFYIVFDEISFNSSYNNNSLKQLITSNTSTLRDAYAHYREHRERRASLVATTNEDNFIPDTQGTRRFLVLDIKATVDLNQFPLPYEGAYAQAMYLINNGFDSYPTQEESRLISQHNSVYAKIVDCEEALATFMRKTDDTTKTEAKSAGDIMQELSRRGYKGQGFSASSIGKALKKMGFESRLIHGTRKYYVSIVPYEEHHAENRRDAALFTPQIE